MSQEDFDLHVVALLGALKSSDGHFAQIDRPKLAAFAQELVNDAERARASEAEQAEELKRLRDLLRLARGLGKLGADWVQSRHMGDMSHAKEFKAEWGRIQELIDAALASEAGSVRRKE
jgi:hypothetical protein